MHISHLPFLLLLLLHLLIIILFLLLTHNNINIVAYANCVETDRNALLNFKAASFIDDFNVFSSWENDVDCCFWYGVHCDNQSNHSRVVELDLSPWIQPNQFELPRDRVVGKMISPSLLELNELRHLDLSFIDFNYSQRIPDFIGSLNKLRYLNLQYCNLVGQIPPSLGNLSLLQTLNLTDNYMLHTNHLGWISSLHSLEYLDLSWVNILDGEWLQALNTLPMLKQIYLKRCSLHDDLLISPIHMLNASNSLAVLDLSYNHMSLGSSIIPWLLNHSHSLTYIDLRHNSWNGTIPEILWKLTHLAYLDLSGNEIQGIISNNTIESLTSLVHLDLSGNPLQGDFTHLMTHLWNSTLLEYIDLSGNAFFGSLPNMSRFQSLKKLRLFGNQLNGSIEEDYLRLPALVHLDLSINKLTGMIPNLSSCVSLRELYLSNNMFNGTLTETIGNLFQLELLDLGSNQLEGIISEAHLFNLSKLSFLYMSFNSNLTISISPSSTPPFQLEYLILSSCRLGPHFPQWLQNQSSLFVLDISNSNIWDTIPNWFWNISHKLQHLNMSHNSIHGTLPPHLSIGELVDLSFNLLHGTLPQISNVTLDWPTTHGALILSGNKFSGTIVFCYFPNDYHLDLSNNELSGHISLNCFKNLSVLSFLNLENNSLSGNIEISHASCHLSSLHLRNNKFSGNIPKSLGACHNLSILDLGENKFFGTIPDCLSESLTKLLVLSLRSNKLQGSLPSSICHLSRIQVLDISRNELSGTIPKCINNLSLLSTKSEFNSTTDVFHRHISWGSFYDNFRVNWKGQNSEYSHTLWLLKAIDFSCNKFSGEIPIEITRLVELVSLNLSRNNLIGSIPRDINRLKQLDVLDLSWNNLSGAIPSTLSQLSLLGTLNLSFNNLSGKIPWVNHLTTFDNASYLGNPRLCGPPLVSKLCTDDGGIFKKPIFMDRANKYIFKTRELYISIAFGFIVGFWGAFGTLLFNKAWNISLIKVRYT